MYKNIAWKKNILYNINRKEIISELREGKISMLQQKADRSWKFRVSHSYVSDYKVEDINDLIEDELISRNYNDLVRAFMFSLLRKRAKRLLS